VEIVGDGPGLQAPGKVVRNDASVHNRTGHPESCAAEAAVTPLVPGFDQGSAKGVKQGFKAGEVPGWKAEAEYGIKT
jgi:hypothetical protein